MRSLKKSPLGGLVSVLAAALPVCTACGAAAAQPPLIEQVQPVEVKAEPSWRVGRSEKLLDLLDEHVEWLLRNDPLNASRRGDDRYATLLPDVSIAATAHRVIEARERLTRLRALERAGFTSADALDADLLEWELRGVVEGAKFHPEQMPVSLQHGPQVRLPQMADSLPLRTRKQIEDYAARLGAIPGHLVQTTRQMREGMREGRMPPKVVVKGTWDQCLMNATDDMEESPSLSPFYKPFRALPANDPACVQARETIAKKIVPAFRRFAAFLRDEYYPACRDTLGASEGKDGHERYDFALREHTTTELTAEQIHDIGLKEVSRIRAEMMEVIARSDFSAKDELTGDALFEAFVSYLRTDARFYCTSGEELLAGYRDICKRMDAGLPRLFGKLPRLPYGVRETPAFAAPTAPTAYYYPGSMSGGVPGYFLANTHRLDQRPKYEMTALALHEAVPGHHLQIALAQELEEHHPFHEFLDCNAFVEGWGLYAERLGMEVEEESAPADEQSGGRGRGLYADPYDDFGRLTYEMWRACRLVVDTGIHAQGWTRERAIDFMEKNTALSRHNIEREVDRYIAWPGQATAYKIGQLKILEIRKKAEERLGAKFDIRSFHDAVLDSGAIPLSALEQRMERWMSTGE